MFADNSHAWIIAPYSSDRVRRFECFTHPSAASYHINCHHNLGGPYTGTSELLRRMIPEIARSWPDLASDHATAILLVAPELTSMVSVSEATLATLATPEDQARFPSRERTMRISHGLVDFLLQYLSVSETRLSLFFDNVHMAASLDQEFLAILLRRADPQTLLVSVGTPSEQVPEQLQTALTRYTHIVRPIPMSLTEQRQKRHEWQLPEIWGNWLEKHIDAWEGAWTAVTRLANLLNLNECIPESTNLEQELQRLVAHLPLAQREALAQAYVASAHTSDALLERVAYQALDPRRCQQLHDEQAVFLALLSQQSLRLGALPFHQEQGTGSPDTVQTLLTALRYCFHMGYYEAAVDFGQRGRAFTNAKENFEQYWAFTGPLAISFVILDRIDEAMALYQEVEALTKDVVVYKRIAYIKSLLYSKYYKEEQRDYALAKKWIHTAIQAAKSLGLSPKEEIMEVTFLENPLALIELRLGNVDEAELLLSEGLERLSHVCEPHEHISHRVILRLNRARVFTLKKEFERALDDYAHVIAQDPYYGEHYFERGNLYRQLCRNAEALEDYTRAIASSLPFLEVYYNRAGVLSDLGCDEEALCDYSRVLELDPNHINALVNRANLLFANDDPVAARKDVEQGLKVEPTNAVLQCTLGLLEMGEGHLEQAYHAFTEALKQEPSLVSAWTNRAVLAYEQGDLNAAIDDLSRALAIEENADVFYNRGLAYQEQAQWVEAIADYSRALALSSADTQEILYKRGLCHFYAGDRTQAERDWAQHCSLGPSPYLKDLLQIDPHALSQCAPGWTGNAA